MPPSCVIALVEPFWVGHPETQLKIFTEILLRQKNHRVLVLCRHPEVIRSWIDNAHPDEASRCFTASFAFCDTRGEFANTTLASWAYAHQSLLDAERRWGFTVDKVFITWLDLFICNAPEQVATLMPRPWVGLYLFPSYLRTLSPWSRIFPPKRMALDQTFFKTSHCRGVAVLDEGLTKKLSPLVSRANIHVLPDVPDTTSPSSIPPLVQLLLQKAAGRPIVGLLGVLGRRKGTMAFLKAMQNMDPARHFFLLAGRLGREERKTYGPDLAALDELIAGAEKQGNGLIHLGHIETEETFNALVAACSVLYLAYEGHHHSSGILGKAAHFNKLVIAPDKGCIAERVREFRLGIPIRAGSAAGTMAAIQKLCHSPSQSSRVAQARFYDYQARHSRDVLGNSLNRLLEEIP